MTRITNQSNIQDLAKFMQNVGDGAKIRGRVVTDTSGKPLTWTDKFGSKRPLIELYASKNMHKPDCWKSDSQIKDQTAKRKLASEALWKIFDNSGPGMSTDELAFQGLDVKTTRLMCRVTLEATTDRTFDTDYSGKDVKMLLAGAEKAQ